MTNLATYLLSLSLAGSVAVTQARTASDPAIMNVNPDSTTWDGADAYVNSVANGLYILDVFSRNYRSTARMIKLGPNP
ncbi:MAG: hypothetical protein HQ542_02780 [Bacteroidia bacterium]|nr:hypothetical protein [Bacteroidia bacterium]